MKYTYQLFRMELGIGGETIFFYRAEIEATDILKAEEFFKDSGYMSKENNYIISIVGR